MADILAIDDEKAWRELYAEALAEAGHKVRACKDGVEALEEITEKLPDLVILDVKMRPSGALLLEAIRQFWSHVPVIVCTAYASYRDDHRLCGADAFLVKSSGTGELTETVERILARGNDSTGRAWRAARE